MNLWLCKYMNKINEMNDMNKWNNCQYHKLHKIIVLCVFSDFVEYLDACVCNADIYFIMYRSASLSSTLILS